jgi:hypothetical protein
MDTNATNDRQQETPEGEAAQQATFLQGGIVAGIGKRFGTERLTEAVTGSALITAALVLAPHLPFASMINCGGSPATLLTC